MDEIVRVLLLKDGRTFVTKLQEVQGNEIGEPDCVMIDPVLDNPEEPEIEKCMVRFPERRLTDDTKMAILSDNILTMVNPSNTLLSEYLVVISD